MWLVSKPLALSHRSHRCASSWLLNDMLRHVVSSGTGRGAALGSRAAAGKTGTSQNFRDAWFVGHANRLTTGIWFGNDDNSSTRKLTGGNLPAKVWKSYMQVAIGAANADIAPEVVSLPEKVAVPTPRPNQRVANFRPSRPIPIKQQLTVSRAPAPTSIRKESGTLRDRVNSLISRRNSISGCC